MACHNLDSKLLCLLFASIILASCFYAQADAARLCGGTDILLVADGDSITAGQNSTDGRGSFVERAALTTDHPGEVIVTAVSQSVLGSPRDPQGSNSLFGRVRQDNAILSEKKKGRLAILSILIGRNDLVGYVGGPPAYARQLALYIAQMRQAGWDRVVLGTLPPSAWPPFVKPRDELNDLIRTPGWRSAHGIDAIADFASSRAMGSSEAASDTAYFADGTHPNNHGYATLAPIFGAAVERARCAR